MEEFVEPARADAEARDDLAGMQRLLTPGDHALLDEIEHGIGDDVRVNAEIAAIVQMPQRLVGNAPEIDMQCRAVLDDLGDIAGNALGNRIGGLMRVFDERSLDADKAIDPVDVQERVAERPRHERIDLGDNRLGVAQHAHGDIDRDAEADEAVRVGRRHLHEGNISLDAPVLGQMRDLGERDRHIFGLPAMHERAHVGADEEAAMAIGGPLLDPERLQARGQEIEELDVGRVGFRRSSASTRLIGVAQAVPTKTRWPGFTTSTAASAEHSLSAISASCGPSLRVPELGECARGDPRLIMPSILKTPGFRKHKRGGRGPALT